MELDKAEEAEVVEATVSDLVDAIAATNEGTGSDGKERFTTTSPKLVGERTHLRRDGRCTGAERRLPNRSV